MGLHVAPVLLGRLRCLRSLQLDRHDIIETEANSSATLGLALFSGCDILKSSMVRHSSPQLRRRVPRPDLLGREGTCQYSGLYIHAHKSFAINQYLYIQNHKPFIINESMVYTGGGYSTGNLGCGPFFLISRFCIYTRGSPLSSTNICIYRTASPLL